MNKEIKIREALFKELKRISYVTKIAYKTPFAKNGVVTLPHFSNDLENEFLNKKVGILVALHSNKIIGVQKYKKISEKDLYIYQLAVLKGYRGLGVGSRLIKESEKIAHSNKMKKVLLDCMKEKKLPDYYISLGYKIDKIKKIKDHHMVYMSKEI